MYDSNLFNTFYFRNRWLTGSSQKNDTITVDSEKLKSDVTQNELKQDVTDNPLNLANRSSTNVPEQELKFLKILSTVTWGMTTLFICRNLPYTILLHLLIAVVAATIKYSRHQTQKSRLTTIYLHVLII